MATNTAACLGGRVESSCDAFAADRGSESRQRFSSPPPTEDSRCHSHNRCSEEKSRCRNPHCETDSFNNRIRHISSADMPGLPSEAAADEPALQNTMDCPLWKSHMAGCLAFFRGNSRETRRAVLRQQQNRVTSPILKLPVELIIMILEFSCLGESFYTSRRTALQVSSLWRQTIIGNPHLWTNLTVDLPISTKTRRTRKVTDRVHTLCDRAGASLLDFSLFVPSTQQLQAFSGSLNSVLPRCETFSFYNVDSYGCKSSMTSLNLSRAKGMKRLKLVKAGFETDDSTATSLELLLEILRGCSKLVMLDLQCVVARNPPPTSYMPVLLGDLQELTVVDRDEDLGLKDFFEALVTPSLRRLIIASHSWDRLLVPRCEDNFLVLRSLRMSGSSFRGPPLIAWLSQMPQLEELEISTMNFDRDWPTAVHYEAEVQQRHTDQLVPELQVARFIGCTGAEGFIRLLLDPFSALRKIVDSNRGQRSHVQLHVEHCSHLSGDFNDWARETFPHFTLV